MACINVHTYYTVTLKSRLRVTQGHWKRNHWTDHIHDLLVVVEFFDVEYYCDFDYYCDLEMWVRGHSRSLKVVPFESLGTVSLALSEIFGIKQWPDLEICVWVDQGH